MKFPLSFFGGSNYGLDGNQILHTSSENKGFSPETTQFVNTVLKEAISFESDAEIFRYASDQVQIEGLFVELGTGRGRSTNFLAALNPKKIVYTFDSYLGLPADWDRGSVYVPGHLFAWLEGEELPSFLLNVELKKGWFSETLPKFVEMHSDEPIAFLHIDCDIYESSAQGFNLLGPLIVEGTVILFDEFYNYPTYRDHEYRALQEFLEKYAWDAHYLAYNAHHEQVAIRIRKKSDV